MQGASPCPEGLASGPRTLFPLCFMESLVLMRHARCVTLSREWLTVPRVCGAGERCSTPALVRL